MEYSERVEPGKYGFYLVFGCFMAVMSIVMMTHIFDHIALIINGKTINPFLDAFLDIIQASRAKFLSIVVFCLIGFYFLYCAQKGNIKVGLRFYQA